MPLAPGTRVGSYEITSLIGSGGMGEVYRARDAALNRDVAIKVVRDDIAGVDRLARFRREAQVLAGLNHPNIGAIYGMEGSALVLEIVEGETLADRIARGVIPIDDALPIARQIADAVAAAHDQGIVHRDLKPANIKLRPDGTVKVLDFGLAKVFSDDPSSIDRDHSPTLSLGATRAGVILGTAAYMSPEQARGKAVDKRTDIWAFGCVLYEMLTGRRAFAGDEVSDTLAFVITKEIDWTALPAATPPAIKRLLLRCLEKDRSQRLRDIGDAMLDLRDATAVTPEVRQAHASSPRLRIAVAVAAGMLAGAATGAAVMWTQRPTSAPPVVRRFALAMPTALSWAPGIPNRTVVLSPDGSRLAFVSSTGALTLRALDSLDYVPVGGLGVAAAPFFSPDGRSVGVFLAGTTDLRRVAVAGGPPVQVIRLSGVARGATWLPDGRIILATTDLASGLYAVPSTGGDAKMLTKPDAALHEIDHVWPEALPQGRGVLFTVLKDGGPTNAEIAVLDLRSGERKLLLRGGIDAQYVPSGHLIFGSAGTVRAVAFDVDRLEVRGDPVAVPMGIAVTPAGVINGAVSADGTLVYLPGSSVVAGQRRLAWVDRQGREELIGSEAQAFAVPRVSRDGSHIAVHLDSDIPDVAVLDVARGTLRRLTFGKAQNIRPAWAPDGSSVFFRSDVDGPGIYRKAGDGSGSLQRITPVMGDGSPHAFTPDGKTMVYAQIEPTTARDLWMIDADGKEKAQPLVVEPGDQANAVISPNGRWLAYHASEVGEIYVRPFPNVGDGRWQVVASGAKWPMWSRDGRELFFVTARGISSIAVDADRTFQWSAPKPLFDASYVGFSGLAGPRNYDLSPDGRRFLVIKEGGRAQQASELVVVENWLEELKRLAPASR